MRGKAGWRMGNKFLVRSTFFTFNVLRFHDVLWGYKKITRHSINFIPTGKTYEAIVACDGGTAPRGRFTATAISSPRRSTSTARTSCAAWNSAARNGRRRQARHNALGHRTR